MVKAKRYLAAFTWNRPRDQDPLLYRDLSATVLHRLDHYLGESQPLSGGGLLRWYRDHECDHGHRQMGSARAMLEQIGDIGERLGPKPLRLARVALRRFDDGLEQLDNLGYSVRYLANQLPPTPDVRTVKAAYQFDIARGVLRRMAKYPEETSPEPPRPEMQ